MYIMLSIGNILAVFFCKAIGIFALCTDFLKFVGPSGQKITRTGNTAKYASPGVRQNFLFVYFFFAPEIENATGMPEQSRSTQN